MTTANEAQPVDAELQRRYAGLRRPTDGPHPSEDDWVRLAEGTLDEASRVRLADHVTACARCAEVFRAVDHVRRGAGALGAETPSRATGRLGGVSRGWYGLALAATLVFAVAGAVRWSGRGAVPATDDPMGVPAPATNSVAVSSAPVTPASAPPRAWAALLTAPAITLPAALALEMRGAPTSAGGFMPAFGAAIGPYREGRYEQAAAALDGVTRRYPDIAEGWFYLGASRLLAGDAAGAVAPLERARDSTVLAAEARWLGAVALERAGRGPDADAALTAMCASDPDNRARACAAGPVAP
jgi:hypothetical protein